MKAIVAMAENRVIGAGGKIPWHVTGDLPFFKKTTMGHPIVMGRKTYESLGRPLPGRKNIILSRTMQAPLGVTVINNLEELRQLALPPEEIFVIGGAEIYQLLLPECTTLFVTHVHRSVEGDTFFPDFEQEFELQKILLKTPEFTIGEYQRKKVNF